MATKTPAPREDRPSVWARMANWSFFERIRYSNLAESLRARSSAKRVKSRINERRGGSVGQPPKLRRKR